MVLCGSATTVVPADTPPGRRGRPVSAPPPSPLPSRQLQRRARAPSGATLPSHSPACCLTASVFPTRDPAVVVEVVSGSALVGWRPAGRAAHAPGQGALRAATHVLPPGTRGMPLSPPTSQWCDAGACGTAPDVAGGWSLEAALLGVRPPAATAGAAAAAPARFACVDGCRRTGEVGGGGGGGRG